MYTISWRSVIRRARRSTWVTTRLSPRRRHSRSRASSVRPSRRVSRDFFGADHLAPRGAQRIFLTECNLELWLKHTHICKWQIMWSWRVRLQSHGDACRLNGNESCPDKDDRCRELCITISADCDFLKSIQVRLFSTRCDIECVKGFCSDSNSRGFGRKIIHMITSIIQAMINDSIFWWGSSSLVVSHNKRPHECCCRPPRPLVIYNHYFVPRHS